MSLPLVITPGDAGHITHHEEIHDILSDVELADLWVVARYLSDILANRGAAGRSGSLFLATNVGDSGSLSLDNGSAWNDLWKFMPNAVWNLLAGAGTDNISQIKLPSCRVGKSVAQTLASAALTSRTALTWDDESSSNLWDNDTLHNAAALTSRFTATRDGYYLLGANVIFDSNSTGQRSCALRKNGTTEFCIEDRDAVTGNVQMNIVHVVEMEVSDYVEVLASQNSGSPLDVLTSSHAFLLFHGDE